MKAMRDDGGKLWLIVGLSFAYGIFHAAGPGHGKAVISSYMLANEVALGAASCCPSSRPSCRR